MKLDQASSLEQLIAQELRDLLGDKANLDPDTDLRSEGLDSIVTIKLIVNLEVNFDIQIDDQDLLVDTFSTIRKISALLSHKYGVQP
ncbi:acyl carrier protein [Paenibacillus kobensis]|uniref:acyl carrier protein n=1 Tax=Paenibacillus kobensis TaxID=59841 RepID=UPI0013E3CECB|nr:acyl carrier protein [Paenibacillus kobensis]